MRVLLQRIHPGFAEKQGDLQHVGFGDWCHDDVSNDAGEGAGISQVK